MLNKSQIQFLANKAQLDVYTHDGIITGVNNRQHRSASIWCPYEEFKNGLGREDIRFHWLLSDKAYLAGGSCLNWVWGENKNEDYDLFFTNADTLENVYRWIVNFGFEETLNTKYARTMFNKEAKVAIQLVGNKDVEHWGDIGEELRFVSFDRPTKTIGRFDLDVCKFAVDVNAVYFTVGAVLDLLNLTINAKITKNSTHDRILKYNRKGFYIPKIEEVMENATRNEWF